ncbi:DNA polymerase-3 subunit epsilon [Gracilibacillus ureilyticus]|uniref:DNA polymerase-3 subunit epsilon n=1 Tax=Gracilibacillus ureilyticus TaxID=531814 RepID=A0A1H9NJF7_9BACI|nr:exonuclease domain-containing protein [Gracilibacillus ureilyticus]SER36068.1 DNA polymerase-3 subunit epsilon [Gracilibacillus ureilyticus]
MVMNQMLKFIKQMSGYGNDVASISNQTDAGKIAYMRNLQRELKKKDVLNIPFSQLPIVVFDIETTGFYPYNGDRILSIGAIKMIGSEVQKEQMFYKTIYNNSPIAEEIKTLTGLTANELHQAAPLEEVLRQFFQFVGSDTLVAHHSSHEKQFMKHASWTALKTSFQHRIIDTAFLTKVVAPEAQQVTLDEWCEYYKVDIGRRHHALYDAVATAKIWSECVKKVEKMGFENLKDAYTHIASLP